MTNKDEQQLEKWANHLGLGSLVQGLEAAFEAFLPIIEQVDWLLSPFLRHPVDPPKKGE